MDPTNAQISSIVVQQGAITAAGVDIAYVVQQYVNRTIALGQVSTNTIQFVYAGESASNIAQSLNQISYYSNSDTEIYQSFLQVARQVKNIAFIPQFYLVLISRSSPPLNIAQNINTTLGFTNANLSVAGFVGQSLITTKAASAISTEKVSAISYGHNGNVNTASVIASVLKYPTNPSAVIATSVISILRTRKVRNKVSMIIIN